MIPDEVVRMILPKDRAGSNKLTQFSTDLSALVPVGAPCLLTGIDTNVETWGDDTGLVETTVQLNDDLAGTVVVNDLELADVT